MRKITQFYDTDKPDPAKLLLAVDVSSRKLDLYSRYRQGGAEYEISESFPNEVTAIGARLDLLYQTGPEARLQRALVCRRTERPLRAKAYPGGLKGRTLRMDSQSRTHVQGGCCPPWGRGQIGPVGREGLAYAGPDGQGGPAAPACRALATVAPVGPVAGRHHLGGQPDQDSYRKTLEVPVCRLAAKR